MRGDAPTSLVTTGLCRKEVRAGVWGCAKFTSHSLYFRIWKDIFKKGKESDLFTKTYISKITFLIKSSRGWLILVFEAKMYLNLTFLNTQRQCLGYIYILPKEIDHFNILVFVYLCMCLFAYACVLQPWESQSFCSTFPYEIVCADSWGQSLLAATDTAGVMLLDGEVILNQYLPLSSKIKPPIHIHSILCLSECQGQQLTWWWQWCCEHFRPWSSFAQCW